MYQTAVPQYPASIITKYTLKIIIAFTGTNTNMCNLKKGKFLRSITDIYSNIGTYFFFIEMQFIRNHHVLKIG